MSAGPALDRLAPYARASLEVARDLAARLNAEELSPEHWLAALLTDEGCGATRAVLHAFADPQTIGGEVLALCAGIMVVGSARTLPFSVRAIEALEAARQGAAERASPKVTPVDVFQGALARLPGELAGRLEELGATRAGAAEPSSAAEGPPVPRTGPLFRHFSPDALRSLGTSARVAAQLARKAIGPVHLLVGALEVSAELRTRTGLTAARVRLVCGALDEDTTPLPERRPGADARLVQLLEALPPQAETLDVLAWLLEHGNPELTALLRRQKVTSALVERCRGIHRDPPDA